MKDDSRIDNLERQIGRSEASPQRAKRAISRLAVKEISASDNGGITVREAGRRGGLACLRNRGRGFFVRIGKKGQSEMRRKYPGMAAEWGRKGGRPKKPDLAEIMGEARNE